MNEKILIIANYQSSVGGISKVIDMHAKYLRIDGYRVQIFNTKRNNVFIRLMTIFYLIRIAKFDVVHIHCCSAYGFYPAIVGILFSKILFNKHTIITYHGGGAEYFLQRRKQFVKWIITKSDYLTVMNEYLQKVFFKFGIKSVLIRNIIDLNIMYDKKLELTRPKIVSIRNLTKYYNVQDVISAFEMLKKEYPAATLKIAGDGNQTDLLKRKASNIEGIEFLGRLDTWKIQDLLKECNIFVSVPSVDNQPMSILEAFACGCIVISSRVGGIVDMITEMETGLLVDVNNPEQIYSRMKWVIENELESIRIINNSRLELKKYEWDAVKQKLYDLYFH